MYKCPSAGGCLIEVNSGGSCLCMVNREHFCKVMVAGEGGGRRGTRGRLDSCRHTHLSLCWLRAIARSSLCVYFSSALQHCVHQCWRPNRDTFGVTDVGSTWGPEPKCLGHWVTLSVETSGMNGAVKIQCWEENTVAKISEIHVVYLFISGKCVFSI